MDRYEAAPRRRRRVRLPALRVFAWLTLTLPLAPLPGVTQTISGRLLDLDTDLPISLGLVMMYTESGDSVAATISSPTGHFTLTSPTPGSFMLLAAALGYEETPAGVFELGSGGSMTVDYRLPPQPLPIDELVVSLNRPVQAHHLVRNGFVRRFQRGMGVFVTPYEIERSAARSTEALLEGMPGIRVGPVRDMGVPRPDVETIQIRMPDGSACEPTVYLDGIWVPYSPDAGLSLSGVAPLGTVEAVEVYRRPAEIPVEYTIRTSQRTGPGCGVLLVWTKAGRAPGQAPRRGDGSVVADAPPGGLPPVAEQGPPPEAGEQIRMALEPSIAAARGLDSPWQGMFVMVQDGEVVANDPVIGRAVSIPLGAVSALQVSRERPPHHALVRGALAGAAMGLGTWFGLSFLCSWSDCNGAVERPWLAAGLTGTFVGVLVHSRGPGQQWIGTDLASIATLPGVDLAVRVPAGGR